jgi:hypothetical protein
MVGHASLKVASNKVANHEKTCSNNQHIFLQFALDTFGFLSPEVVDILHRAQKILLSNVMSHRFLNDVLTSKKT